MYRVTAGTATGSIFQKEVLTMYAALQWAGLFLAFHDCYILDITKVSS